MHEQQYLEAFNVLSTSRNVTFGGISSIPLSEIKAYCDLTGITDLDHIQDLLYIITICDDFYLSEISKRAPKNGSSTGNKPANRRGQSANGRRR